jgi:hypothetical protein
MSRKLHPRDKGRGGGATCWTPKYHTIILKTQVAQSHNKLPQHMPHPNLKHLSPAPHCVCLGSNSGSLSGTQDSQSGTGECSLQKHWSSHATNFSGITPHVHIAIYITHGIVQLVHLMLCNYRIISISIMGPRNNLFYIQSMFMTYGTNTSQLHVCSVMVWMRYQVTIILQTLWRTQFTHWAIWYTQCFGNWVYSRLQQFIITKLNWFFLL